MNRPADLYRQYVIDQDITEPPAGQGEAATRRAPLGARWWLGGFAVLFLLFAAWSLAAPYDGTPDEYAHVVRAAGVAGGQIAPRPVAAVQGAGAFQVVPAGLVRKTECWKLHPKVPASCARPPGSDRTPRRVATPAGRYQPGYYALVGLPLRLWPGMPGLLLARLISAAASAALLAAALQAILRYSRHRFMLAGFLVVVTPIAAQMASAINPNGLEIAAAIALFAAGIPLIRGGLPTVPRGLLALAGTSALVLAILRTPGPLYLAVALAGLALPVRLASLRRLAAAPPVRRWAIVVTAGALASSAWVLLMHETALGTYRYGRLYRYGQALMLVIDRWRAYLDEMVGVTAWLDTRMAMPAYLLWETAALTLVVAAVVVGARADRWRLAILVAGGAGIPTLTQLIYVRRTGFIIQGRYLLPVLAGVVLLSTFILERRAFGVALCARLTRMIAVVLVPIHLVSLVYTMARWQSGLPAVGGFGPLRLNPFAGSWHPVVGSVTPLLLEAAGLSALIVLVWRATAVHRLSLRVDPVARPEVQEVAAAGASGADGAVPAVEAMPCVARSEVDTLP